MKLPNLKENIYYFAGPENGHYHSLYYSLPVDWGEAVWLKFGVEKILRKKFGNKKNKCTISCQNNIKENILWLIGYLDHNFICGWPKKSLVTSSLAAC